MDFFYRGEIMRELATTRLFNKFWIWYGRVREKNWMALKWYQKLILILVDLSLTILSVYFFIRNFG